MLEGRALLQEAESKLYSKPIEIPSIHGILWSKCEKPAQATLEH